MRDFKNRFVTAGSTIKKQAYNPERRIVRLF